MIKYNVLMHYQTPNVNSVTAVTSHSRRKNARGDVKSLITSKIESLAQHNFFNADDVQGTIDPAEITLFDEEGAIILHVCYYYEVVADAETT